MSKPMNEQELRELKQKIFSLTVDTGRKFMQTRVLEDWTLSKRIIELVEAYITANYTPNTKLKALIEASEKLNLEFHGRPDCKNCALQEQLAELIKDNKL